MGAAKQIRLLFLLQGFYLLTGSLIYFSHGGFVQTRSFVLGSLFSLANFEILRRIGVTLQPLLEGNVEAKKLGPTVSILLVLKFIFWGIVVAILVWTNIVQEIPFVAGMLGLLFAGLGLGIREYFNGRA